jgi:manganese/iron transport system substrate-binding protein
MKNKALWIISGFAALMLLLAACAPAQTVESTPVPEEPAVAEEEPSAAATESVAETEETASIRVLASTTFLADITQNVAGGRVKVESMLYYGADPHTYQANPSDVVKVTESDVLILNGLEYEYFIEQLLENADGERLVVEASAGLEPREMAEHEEEGEGDHSPEQHAAEICEDLEGKRANEEVQSGEDVASAAELHDEEELAGEEHTHEREVIQVKLHAQSDGSYAGYLLFDAESEQGYAFIMPQGGIMVSDETGAEMEAEQNLVIDCAGMTAGSVYKLPAGEYLVALSGFAAEIIPFSAAPMHPEGHSHEAGDPHMWLDPNLVITYVENIRDGLSQADPDGAQTYSANADAYIAQLRDLDAFIKEQVESIPAERRLLVTNHEALGYFAERYGFEIVDTILPSFSSAASASAQEIAGAVDAVRASGAPAIFLGEVENTVLADQIAAETGATVVNTLYLETLTEGEPAATYIDMMRYNATQIVDALK